MRTTDSLQPVLAAIHKLPSTGILVLDIDETILHSGEGVGSETWYDQRIRTSVANGMSMDAAVLEANDAWEAMQSNLPVFLTEPTLIEILEACSKKGIRTLGLTARRPEMAVATRAQLSAIGVDLAKSAWCKKTVVLNPLARHEDGILFGGPLVDKGIALFSFFNQVEALPTGIIFVDDKPNHIQSVEEKCEGNQVPSTCFHYVRPGRKAA